MSPEFGEALDRGLTALRLQVDAAIGRHRP